MLQRLTEILPSQSAFDDEIHLPYDQRERARARAESQTGDDVGIFLERGLVLREGDCLKGDGTKVYRVVAQPEPLSVVRANSTHELARAAYHLGNRHVRLQVMEDYLAYQPDHVLDEMVKRLGFAVEHQKRPFEPESGAYHRGGHDHSHPHGQGQVVEEQE